MLGYNMHTYLLLLARSPTSASSERAVSKAADSEPWKDGGAGPYQYHPGGDTSVKKDAPSALNVVVIPNVTLPKARRLASSTHFEHMY